MRKVFRNAVNCRFCVFFAKNDRMRATGTLLALSQWIFALGRELNLYTDKQCPQRAAEQTIVYEKREDK
jgi:hypothetical protein